MLKGYKWRIIGNSLFMQKSSEGDEKLSDLFGKYDESIRLSYQNATRLYMHLKNIVTLYSEMEDPDDVTKEVYRDSIIKKYEMLEEVVWKLLSKMFKSSGLEINNPRGCYKQAFKEGLIEDIELWNDILASRNSTAHVYNEEDYENIKNKIVHHYLSAIEKLLEKVGEQM